MAAHILVCGYGAQGKAVIGAYESQGAQRSHIAVVDICPAKAAKAGRRGHVSIRGDAASLHSLRLGHAGVVDIVAVCVPDNATSHVVRAIKMIAPKTPVQVVVRESSARTHVKAAGADYVLVLADIAGRLLAQSALAELPFKKGI